MNLKFGLIAVSSLALVLTACPGGMDTGSKYSKFGLVGLTNTGTSKVFTGLFYKLPTPVSQPTTGTAFAEDTCVVINALTDVPKAPGAGNQQAIALDAGTELTVKNATGTLATMLASSAGSFSTPSTTIPDASGATIETPGAADGFPKMTATFPNELAAFTFGPTKDITKDTVFEWTTLTPGAVVSIGVLSVVGTNSVIAFCFAKDDGSFTFPDSVKTELAAKGFTTGGLLLANKGTFKFVPQGDALLIMQTARAATFVP
jgi:hypothetical protein